MFSFLSSPSLFFYSLEKSVWGKKGLLGASCEDPQVSSVYLRILVRRQPQTESRKLETCQVHTPSVCPFPGHPYLLGSNLPPLMSLLHFPYKSLFLHWNEEDGFQTSVPHFPGGQRLSKPLSFTPTTFHSGIVSRSNRQLDLCLISNCFKNQIVISFLSFRWVIVCLKKLPIVNETYKWNS